MSALEGRKGLSWPVWAVLVSVGALLAALMASGPYALAWSWPPLRRATLIKIEGPVEAVAAGQVAIAGQPMALPDDLDVALAVGDWALVHAERDAAGNLVARTLVLVDRTAAGQATPAMSEARVEFEGRIEQLSPRDDGLGAWVVGGVQVWVDARTVVHGQPIVGADAEVRGEQQGPQAAVATEVWVIAPEERPLMVEGRIAALSAQDGAKRGSLALSDGKEPLPYAFILDERTFLDESRGRAEVDMWAEVRAVPQEDGTLWVQYIRVLRP